MKVYRRVEPRTNTLDDATILCLVRLSNIKYSNVFVTEGFVPLSKIKEKNGGRILRCWDIRCIKLPGSKGLYINDEIEGCPLFVCKISDTEPYVYIIISDEAHRDGIFCYRYIGEI